MAAKTRKQELQELAESVRNPLRLRMVICGLALTIGYLAIYGPLSERIARASRKLKDVEKRESAARDSEILRAHVQRFKSRLGPDGDPNESIRYVLDGIRALPLQLVRFDSQGTFAVGPYEAVALDPPVRSLLAVDRVG